MNEKQIYEAPAIEEMELNQFVVISGTSDNELFKDNLTGLDDDLGDL